MQAFNNLRIGARLGIGFTLLIASALAIAVYARFALGGVNAELHLLTDDRVVKVEQLESVKDNVNVIAQAVRNIALLTESARKQAEVQAIEQARTANAALVRQLEESITNEKGQQLLKAAGAARVPYSQHVDKVVEYGRANMAEDATLLLVGELRQSQAAYTARLQDLIVFQKELMAQSGRDVDQAVSLAGTVMLVIAVLAGLAGAALAWVVTRSITAPINRAVALAETVARGDLRTRIEVTSRDETGRLLAALQRMNDALVRTVSAVRGNADSVATASSQIAQGNADLSQRTEEQASNLQQTAASMEQLTATVKQNADTARQAAQLASSASTVAGAGGAVVGRVVATMDDITASSKKIADIIGTIDGIAFQTNILALNAAVEAARAGEQGRGFAVVAAEVRSLAQRSAEAAKEIKSLIGASVEKVENGVALVGDAGRTMGEIVAQVQKVSDLIGEISAASVEQTGGIGQIGDAIAQLDQVTQQNAALVEESAAAAESLKGQAAQLAQAVAFFTVDDAAAHAPSTPVAVAPARPATPRRAPEVAPAAAGGEDWTSF
jgi:methyl-accepting chemotaxis protein